MPTAATTARRSQTALDRSSPMMPAPENSTEDFDMVSQNPADYYRNPLEIVEDPQLTDDERLRLLEEWHTDISNKLTADEEGMTPLHARDSARDANFLADIAQAREKIEADAQQPTGIRGALARLWHRL